MAFLDRRRQIHDILTNLSEDVHVYYQPPESVRMVYPAIRYHRLEISTRHADNLPYDIAPTYEVIVIDEDPDSILVEKLSKLPGSKHNRHYTINNLNHDVFILH